MSKRCSVACDTPDGVRLCELQLPDAANIGEALAAARGVLADARVDWEHAAAGIYGQIYPRTHVPADGERIELYRSLQLDPRSRRHAHVAAAAQRRRRP